MMGEIVPEFVAETCFELGRGVVKPDRIVVQARQTAAV
jgi:hypothetical protein